MNAVWQGNEGFVSIFLDDGEGNRINADGDPYDDDNDSPLVSMCYWQDAAINDSLAVVRRPSTGRPRRRIVAVGAREYESTIASLYVGASVDFKERLRDRDTSFQLWMTLLGFPHVAHEEIHILAAAKIPEITFSWSENKDILYNLKLDAEIYIPPETI